MAAGRLGRDGALPICLVHEDGSEVACDRALVVSCEVWSGFDAQLDAPLTTSSLHWHKWVPIIGSECRVQRSASARKGVLPGTSVPRDNGQVGQHAPTRLMMPKMRPPRENMVRYSPSRLLGTGEILANACRVNGTCVSSNVHGPVDQDQRHAPCKIPAAGALGCINMRILSVQLRMGLRTRRNAVANRSLGAHHAPELLRYMVHRHCDHLIAAMSWEMHLEVIVDGPRRAERRARAVHHDGEDAECHVDVHLKRRKTGFQAKACRVPV